MQCYQRIYYVRMVALSFYRKERAMEKIDAIYARQSIDKVDSISIESQIEFCKYETRGAPYKVYQDKGYSGKNTDRPEFQQMLVAIRKGEIKRVICYKLDRCSRSILDFAALMEEFQKYDVEFVSCTEKFDTSSPMGRAMLNICIVFAQLERETIQQRVFDAYHSRNKRGFYMGGKVPFGFSLEPYCLEGKKTSRYVMNEEEVKILELMYSIYERPLTSLGDVVNVLMDAGIKHPRKKDGRWTRTHIGRMLHNPAYVKADLDVYNFFKENGVIIHNNPEDFIGTNGCYLYSEKGKTHPNYRLEGHHLVLAPHAGIVPSDIWLRCRKKQKYAGETVRQCKIKNTWLAGKIKCSKCGYALVVRKTVKGSGKEFRYIICSEANDAGNKCDGVHGLKADQIEDIVSDEIRKKLEMFSSLSAPQESRADPEICELQIRIARLEQEIEKATEKALEASGALVKYLSDRVTELDEQKTACISRLRQLESAAQDKECNVTQITGYVSRWEQLSLEDKLIVVDALIQKIKLSESEMTIIWKI